jgi:hypothetical protein
VLITCGGAGSGPGHLGASGPSCVYARLASVLPLEHDCAVLQAVYRRAGNVADAVRDVRAAMDWTLERRWGPIILMGWSMVRGHVTQCTCCCGVSCGDDM